MIAGRFERERVRCRTEREDEEASWTRRNRFASLPLYLWLVHAHVLLFRFLPAFPGPPARRCRDSLDFIIRSLSGVEVAERRLRLTPSGASRNCRIDKLLYSTIAPLLSLESRPFPASSGPRSARSAPPQCPTARCVTGRTSRSCRSEGRSAGPSQQTFEAEAGRRLRRNSTHPLPGPHPARPTSVGK